MGHRKRVRNTGGKKNGGHHSRYEKGELYNKLPNVSCIKIVATNPAGSKKKEHCKPIAFFAFITDRRDSSPIGVEWLVHSMVHMGLNGANG